MATITKKFRLISFFKDKKGNTVIIQKPNLYIWLAIGLFLTKYLFEGTINNLLSFAIYIVLFAWAFDEVIRGDSKFRQTLGLFIGLLVVLGILL